MCAQHQVLQTSTLLSTTRLQTFCCEREILQNEIPAVPEQANQRSDPGPGATVEARGFVGVAFRVSAEPSKCECVCVRLVFRQNLIRIGNDAIPTLFGLNRSPGTQQLKGRFLTVWRL